MVAANILMFFVPDEGMNYNEDMEPPFINFCHYEKSNFCSLHKQLLTKHGKTCPSCTNIRNTKKWKATIKNILVLKLCKFWGFHPEYYIPEFESLAFNIQHVYIIVKINVKVNRMECIWVETKIANANRYIILQKYFML